MANFITEFNKSYIDNMNLLLKETTNFYKKREECIKCQEHERLKKCEECKGWIYQKKSIIENTRLLINHLIISEKTLNQLFDKSYDKKFEIRQVQKELLKELDEYLEPNSKGFIDKHKNLIDEVNTNLLKIYTSRGKDFNQIKIKGLFLDKNDFNEIIENLKLFKDEIIGENSFLSMPKKERYDCFCVLKKNNLINKETFESYNKILNKKIAEIDLINRTYILLVRLRYILFDGLNEEIIFSLGFIEDRSLFDESNFSRKLVDYRTDLYKAILSEIPERLKDIFVISNDFITSNDSIQNIYLYLKLNLLIKIHQEMVTDINLNLNLKMSQDLQNYYDKIFAISTESYVFNPDIIPRDYSNLEIFSNLLELKEKDIAKILGITPTKFSRQKNQKRNIDILWADKMFIFYSELEDYLTNKITIPKIGGVIKRNVVNIDLNHSKVILAQFEQQHKKKFNKLQEMKNNITWDSYSDKHLFKLIEALSTYRTKLKKEDVEAIQQLLKIKDGLYNEVRHLEK